MQWRDIGGIFIGSVLIIASSAQGVYNLTRTIGGVRFSSCLGRNYLKDTCKPIQDHLQHHMAREMIINLTGSIIGAVGVVLVVVCAMALVKHSRSHSTNR